MKTGCWAISCATPGRKSGGVRLPVNRPPEFWQNRYRQQAQWTRPLREHLFTRLEPLNHGRLLEVGCGAGALLVELPRPYGLDIDTSLLALAQQAAPQALLTQGDAHQLPYADGSFDLAFCHFVLMWLADPLQALREMRRVVRSGGAVLALAEPDYGGRIDYPAPLASLGTWQETALQQQGARTRLGRMLRSLFHQAALQNVLCGVLGGEWVQETQANVDLEWQVLRSDLEGLVEPELLENYYLMEQNARQTGERVLFVPTFYALGFVP